MGEGGGPMNLRFEMGPIEKVGNPQYQSFFICLDISRTDLRTVTDRLILGTDSGITTS